MINVEEFVENTSREERKSKLCLSEPCHERGLKYSTQLIALVAYHYNTTFPINGNRLVVCHGCMNPKCSNPNHMYWGSKRDNLLDDYESGTRKSIYQSMVELHGEENAKKILKDRSSKGGKNNKNKPKSEEHKNKIKESKKKIDL